MLELTENSATFGLGNSLRKAAGGFNEGLKRSLQQLVYFAIVIVIMPAAD